MRTQEEIIERIKHERNNVDILGLAIGDLMIRLDFENAKQFIKEGTTKEEWDKDRNPGMTREEIIAEIGQYIPFAADKAYNERGISAARSLLHFRNWTWLIGEDEQFNFIDYEDYGKHQIRQVCEVYGFDIPESVS